MKTLKSITELFLVALVLIGLVTCFAWVVTYLLPNTFGTIVVDLVFLIGAIYILKHVND